MIQVDLVGNTLSLWESSLSPSEEKICKCIFQISTHLTSRAILASLQYAAKIHLKIINRLQTKKNGQGIVSTRVVAATMNLLCMNHECVHHIKTIVNICQHQKIKNKPQWPLIALPCKTRVICLSCISNSGILVSSDQHEQASHIHFVYNVFILGI